jgi:cell shape-determining protein MreC
MLRKKKDNSDYEIDRELTWKFAIEKNAEYQEKIEQLEEENKKLKEELAHYKNTEAIQKSNDASRYNPYNHKSYVDREFNAIP